MQNGKFTKEERAYLISLDAVDEVRASSIVYSKAFKQECMARYHAGESPSVIFADAGLASRLIGYKRIERAIHRFKQAELKDALCKTDPPQVRHRNQIDTIKRQKREAVNRQRQIRLKAIRQMEDKLAKQKAKAKAKEEKLIASQAAEIARLKAQVKALKALGTLARKTQRVPQTTQKSERFELIFQLKTADPTFNISAACEALEVSRRGYYDWIGASDKRIKREQADLDAKQQIEAAYNYRGFKKGTRQIVDCLRRKHHVVMNRKKVIRITQKYALMPKRRRKNPYRYIGVDRQPKIAPNTVNRNFRKGEPLKVLSTDITYLPRRNGFSYLSGIIDCQTDVILAYVLSDSMKEQFVLDTYEQLKRYELPDDVWACSDQGSHYTAQAYRDKLAQLGIHQSMSRKACCYDNAPIESFWGRMKEQLPATNDLSHAELVVLVDNYIDYYNNERGQQRLGWLTPVEYANQLAQKKGGKKNRAA